MVDQVLKGPIPMTQVAPKDALISLMFRSNLDTTLVMSLIEQGAEPNTLDHNGRSVLWHAAVACNAELLTRLLDAGASLSAQKDGDDPLLFEVVDQRVRDMPVHETVEVLLARGANPNEASPRWHQTPLLRAVCLPDARLVRTLLAAGASPDVADDQGRNAVEVAIQCGRPDILAELVGSREQAARLLEGRVPDPALAQRRASILESLQLHNEKLAFTRPGYRYEYEVGYEICYEDGAWVRVCNDQYAGDISLERGFVQDGDALIHVLIEDTLWMERRFPPRDRYAQIMDDLEPRGAGDLLLRVKR